MTLFILFNVILAVALAFLTYKYVDLKERHSREFLPDLAYLIGVSAILDSTEGYNKPHANAMLKDAEKIAEGFGLEPETITSLKIAALLHDCGQINLPHDLLKSPRALSQDEWFLLQTHPLIGEMALRSAVPEFEEVPALVRWHHERWDGTGYPDRLTGTEIPIGARILAVVDAASALSEKRPYRAAFSEQEILDKLTKLSGFQFDPSVVQMWSQISRSKTP